MRHMAPNNVEISTILMAIRGKSTNSVLLFPRTRLFALGRFAIIREILNNRRLDSQLALGLMLLSG